MRMRLAFLLALACCLLAVIAQAASEPPAENKQLGGVLVTYQGNKLDIVNFKNLMPTYTFRYQGIIQTMPIEEIKSLSIKGGSVLLERRDGALLKVTGSMVISSTPNVEFVFKDSLSGKESQGQLDPLLINKIIFN